MEYCKACGAPMDEEGICTKNSCPRRKLQIALKKAQEESNDESNE